MRLALPDPARVVRGASARVTGGAGGWTADELVGRAPGLGGNVGG
jgi:hypothetical protein